MEYKTKPDLIIFQSENKMAITILGRTMNMEVKKEIHIQPHHKRDDLDSTLAKIQIQVGIFYIFF